MVVREISLDWEAKKSLEDLLNSCPQLYSKRGKV